MPARSDLGVGRAGDQRQEAVQLGGQRLAAETSAGISMMVCAL